MFFSLKHNVSQLRNMLEHKRSTESLQLFELASFLSKVTLSSLEREIRFPCQATGKVLGARNLFLSLTVFSIQVFTIQEKRRIDWEVLCGPKVWPTTQHFHKMEFGNCQFTLVWLQLVPFSADCPKWLLRPLKHLRVKEREVPFLFLTNLGNYALLSPFYRWGKMRIMEVRQLTQV